MKIVMITTNDPAGMGINFTNAINRYTEHQCRLITTEQRYGIDFGKDLHVPDLTDEQIDNLGDVLRHADIFHFHMISDEHMMVGPYLVNDFIKGKQVLHHHHGHPQFRSNPGHFAEKYRKLNRRVIVSTPDLLHLLPDATWQPNIVPINDPLYRPQAVKECGSVIIGQSPTRRDLKNCVELEWAVSKVKEKTFKRIIHRSFEKMQHDRCLIEKRKCHIIFDHMQGYFGVSSLESLSQGKPVLAGLDDWNIMHLEEVAQGGDIPWVVVRNQRALKSKLLDFCDDEFLITEIGHQSRVFMEKCWSEQRITNMLFSVYETI